MTDEEIVRHFHETNQPWKEEKDSKRWGGIGSTLHIVFFLFGLAIVSIVAMLLFVN